MKPAFRFAGILCAGLLLIAVVSIARECFLLYHFDGYEPLDFRIEGSRREVNDDCYLVGSSGLEKLEFHVSPYQFERYSAVEHDGTTIHPDLEKRHDAWNRGHLVPTEKPQGDSG